MKKLITIILALALCLSFAACGAGTTAATPTEAPAPAPETETPAAPEAPEAPETDNSATPEAPVDQPTGEDVSDLPRETLQAIWDKFTEDELFPAAGGDYSEENSRMDGPGKFAVEAEEELMATFNFPEEYAGIAEGYATLIHMMNLNTFSCVAMTWTSAADTSEMAETIAKKLQNTQWVCGMPDDMAVFRANNCFIYLYGASDIVSSFLNHAVEVYPDAEILVQSSVSLG